MRDGLYRVVRPYLCAGFVVRDGEVVRVDPGGPLVGRHVIITGASSGIGAASAVAVAARGATVSRRCCTSSGSGPKRSTISAPKASISPSSSSSARRR